MGLLANVKVRMIRGSNVDTISTGVVGSLGLEMIRIKLVLSENFFKDFYCVTK
jgi:hypothetical protein